MIALAIYIYKALFCLKIVLISFSLRKLSHKNNYANYVFNNTDYNKFVLYYSRIAEGGSFSFQYGVGPGKCASCLMILFLHMLIVTPNNVGCKVFLDGNFGFNTILFQKSVIASSAKISSSTFARCRHF